MCEAGDVSGAKCMEYIDLAILSMRETVEFRRKNKFSFKRFAVVAKELSELKKVLDCYANSDVLTEF